MFYFSEKCCCYNVRVWTHNRCHFSDEERKEGGNKNGGMTNKRTIKVSSSAHRKKSTCDSIGVFFVVAFAAAHTHISISCIAQVTLFTWRVINGSRIVYLMLEMDELWIEEQGCLSDWRGYGSSSSSSSSGKNTIAGWHNMHTHAHSLNRSKKHSIKWIPAVLCCRLYSTTTTNPSTIATPKSDILDRLQ